MAFQQKSKLIFGVLLSFFVMGGVQPLVSYAAPCLTTPSDPPGGVQGATVQTFIDLGVDPNVTCIENSLWTDPAGFTLGLFITGNEGQGGTPDPTVLGFDNSTTLVGNGNARDFFWVQDEGNVITFPGSPDVNGAITGGRPSQGLIWDLGGPANQAVVFVQVDHGPLPGEVLESTAWLGTSPNVLDDSAWTQAFLDHVYLQGWSPDPNISDGFVAVYRLPNNQTFQFVSVTHGGPGAVNRDGDDEIDAVGGLNFTGGCVDCPLVPEPSTWLLHGSGLIGLAAWRWFSPRGKRCQASEIKGPAWASIHQAGFVMLRYDK
jgi:hypothetical protein